MGIPSVPQDGQKYADLMMGVPMVLEYDNATGGYKLVIDVEGSLDVNMTGVTVAVGTVDTELPAAAALADAMANPTAPAVGAFLMGWHRGSEQWRRVALTPGPQLSLDPDDAWSGQALATVSVPKAEYNGDVADFRSLQLDASENLRVTLISGSFPPGGIVADTELPAAAALSDIDANPTAPAVGAFTMGLVDPAGGEWARVRATNLADSLVNSDVGPALSAASFSMLWDEANGNWQRARATYLGATEIPADVSPATSVAAFLYAIEGVNNEFYRVEGSPGRGLFVTMASGSFPPGASVDTELAAALAAADGTPNPTTAPVLSHLMGYRGDGTWDRVYMGASGSLAVDLITALAKDTDEVTAYITGSTSLNTGGRTIARAVINISGSGGEQTLVAAVGGEKIKVLETLLITDQAVKIFFQSGFTGTALTGPMSLPADGDGFFLSAPDALDNHHFETVAGQALVLDINAAAAIGGWINYYSEP